MKKLILFLFALNFANCSDNPGELGDLQARPALGATSPVETDSSVEHAESEVIPMGAFLFMAKMSYEMENDLEKKNKIAALYNNAINSKADYVRKGTEPGALVFIRVVYDTQSGVAQSFANNGQ